MMSQHRRFMRLASAVGGLVLGATVVLIASRPADPSAAYFVTARASPRPGIPANAIDTRPIVKPAAPKHMPRGPIFRPNPNLTPGAVAETDVRTVCSTPRKSHALFAPGTLNSAISPAIQQAVFAAYRIPQQRTLLYGLDFLVPLQLGGAQSASNIWPVPRTTSGLGFRDKEILNIRMHVLVCHGEMPLAAAQKQIAADWVALWVQFGADQATH